MNEEFCVDDQELTTVIFCEEFEIDVKVIIGFTVEEEPTGKPDPLDSLSEGYRKAPSIDYLIFGLPEFANAYEDEEVHKILNQEKYWVEYEKVLKEAWESGAFNKEEDND